MYVCMYVCMYECMYVCNVCCMYVCMYVCMNVCNVCCMYVCMNECILYELVKRNRNIYLCLDIHNKNISRIKDIIKQLMYFFSFYLKT